MRGEEVQLAGAVASGEIPSDCLVCHPGTHNKWVEVSGGRIATFRTVMTGEMFSMLKRRSILSEVLAGRAKAGEAFSDGVRKSLSGDGLTADLFEARARFLLGRLNAADGASFISGLLIGEDVRVGLGTARGSRVIVMGRPQLTALYSAALEVAGVESERKDGEGAFIAGARSITERLK
jgi:2-dehydro-3-deoxygalactonokinase